MNRKKLSNTNKFNPSEYTRPGVSEEEVNEIKEAFDLFDLDMGGTIDPKEFKAAV